MWGALNETEGLYTLQIYEKSALSSAKWLVYNIHTNLWSKFNFRDNHYDVYGKGIPCAIYFRPSYNTNARLYLIGKSAVNTGCLYKETRYTSQDYVQLQYVEGDFTESTATTTAGSTPGSTGTGTVTVSSTWSVPQVGDMLTTATSLEEADVSAAAKFYVLITAISSDSKTFTYKTVLPVGSSYSTSAAPGATLRLLRAYKSRATYSISNPDATRHYRDATLMFSEFSLNAQQAMTATDLASTDSQSTFTFSDTNNVITRFKRVLIPATQQYANAIYVGVQNYEAGTYYKLLGVSVTFEQVSERNSR
jgi:hypothetical protein